MAATFKIIWDYFVQNIPFINKQNSNPTIKVIPFPNNSKTSCNRKKVKKQIQHQIQLIDLDQQKDHKKEQQIDFKIIFQQKANENQPNQRQQSDEIIYDLRELNQLIKQFQKINKDLNKKERKVQIKDINKIKANISLKKLQQMGLQYMDNYKIDIEDFRALKYSKQKKYYPLIEFKDYHKIKTIWSDAKRNKASQELKRTKNESSQKLTYKTMARLQDGNWLNDQIINQYIQLLEKQAKRRQKMEILNTYFATTTINKSQKVLSRYLVKKNITKQSIVLIPINHENNHWYFAKLDRNSLIIYDSISKTFEFYQNNNVVKVLLKFGKQFFGQDLYLQICEEYPLQDNGYDCGVFTLMGLRDVMQNTEWSFHQGDIKFKRFQVAIQILNENLYNQRIDSE